MQQKKMNGGRNDGKRKKMNPFYFISSQYWYFFLYNHTQNQHYHTYVNFHKTEKRHKCSNFSCVLSKHYIAVFWIINIVIVNQKSTCFIYFFLFKYVGLNTTYPCQRLTNYEEWIQQQHNLFQNWNDGIVLIMEYWI